MENIEKMWSAVAEAREEFKGKGNNYQLGYKELVELMNTTYADGFKGICSAFEYGFIKGIRYQKAQEKKGRVIV